MGKKWRRYERDTDSSLGKVALMIAAAALLALGTCRFAGDRDGLEYVPPVVGVTWGPERPYHAPPEADQQSLRQIILHGCDHRACPHHHSKAWLRANPCEAHPSRLWGC